MWDWCWSRQWAGAALGIRACFRDVGWIVRSALGGREAVVWAAGERQVPVMCGERQWPLFSYFERNRNHFSKHRVSCRGDGSVLWCDVVSEGADPGRRVGIRVADDARACADDPEP